jgi:hypothetical protein
LDSVGYDLKPIRWTEFTTRGHKTATRNHSACNGH